MKSCTLQKNSPYLDVFSLVSLRYAMWLTAELTKRQWPLSVIAAGGHDLLKQQSGFKKLLPLNECSSPDSYFDITVKMKNWHKRQWKSCLWACSGGRRRFPACLDWPGRSHRESSIPKMTLLAARSTSRAGEIISTQPFGKWVAVAAARHQTPWLYNQCTHREENGCSWPERITPSNLQWSESMH